MVPIPVNYILQTIVFISNNTDFHAKGLGDVAGSGKIAASCRSECGP